MENLFDHVTLTFPVDRWLDAGREDGEVVRELAADWPDTDTPPMQGERRSRAMSRSLSASDAVFVICRRSRNLCAS